jgi:hypothetical protein
MTAVLLFIVALLCLFVWLLLNMLEGVAGGFIGIMRGFGAPVEKAPSSEFFKRHLFLFLALAAFGGFLWKLLV